MSDKSLHTTIKGRTSEEENQKDAREHNGAANPYYKDNNKIYKNLGDDIRTLQRVFKVFNETYFYNKLDNSTVINLAYSRSKYKFRIIENHLDSAWKKEMDLPVVKKKKKSKENSEENQNKREEEEQEKQQKEKQEKKEKREKKQELRIIHQEEDCEGIQLSAQILDMETDEALMYLLLSMIALDDSEKKRAYRNESLADPSKKGTYSPLVSRNGTYFSEGFAVKCKEVHINAEPIRNEKGKFDGSFVFSPTDQFRADLRKRRLAKIKFVCSMNGTEKEAPKSKQSTRLLVCPMCGTKIRCTRPEVRVKCCSLEHPTKEVFFEEQKKQ